MKKLIKISESYMNSTTITEVLAEKIEIPFVEAYICKRGRAPGWCVFEYSTGKVIVRSVKTKKQAIEKAIAEMNSNGEARTKMAIGSFPKINF